MPVLINAFGSPERMAAALGVERLDELSARVAKLLDLKMPGSLFDKLKKLGDLFDVAKAGPKRVRSAPCQEVVETDRPIARDAARAQVLAGRRRALHHAADGLHAGSAARARATSACTGSRSSTSGRSACTGRSTRAGPSTSGVAEEQRAQPHGGRHRARRRPGLDLRGARRRCRPGIDEMVFAGLAARTRRRDGARARRSTSRCRPRPRSCSRATSIRAERRLEGPVRRSHRLLLARARLPGLPPDGGHAPQAADLSDDDRRAAAAGGLLARQGDRAHLPADHPDDAARGRGHEHAGRGRLPQPRHRLDQEALPRPGAQGDVRALGARAHDARQEHRRRRRARERPRTSRRSPGARRATSTPGATW